MKSWSSADLNAGGGGGGLRGAAGGRNPPRARGAGAAAPDGSAGNRLRTRHAQLTSYTYSMELYDCRLRSREGSGEQCKVSTFLNNVLDDARQPLSGRTYSGVIGLPSSSCRSGRRSRPRHCRRSRSTSAFSGR